MLLSWHGAEAPKEKPFANLEHEILARVHQWGLHNGARGRMSVLEQLATLQHFGTPTRFIDVSFNAYIGLWFAVEPKHRNGELVHEDKDGRLFAIDVTGRLINEDDVRRSWEDDVKRPWRNLTAPAWCTSAWAWKPPAFEARIASQHGGFLFGGVPSAVAPPGRVGPLQWPKTSAPGDGRWTIDEVRRCLSIALRFHQLDPAAGGVGAEGQPAYTLRITAGAKQQIRDRLARLFGYSHATIYPDFPGFAEFATPELPHTAP
jgi:hypothetical protein